MKHLFLFLKRSLVVLFASILATAAVSAADVTKADNANNLNDPASWTGVATPTAADVAVWNSTVTSANTTALGADTNWAGVKIVDPAGLVTVNAGNKLTLGASGINMSAATADLTLANTVSNSVPQTWDIASGRVLTVSGIVSGTAAAGLTKTGNGTLVLSGANTYSGGTVNNVGILQANAAASFGTGGLTNNNGSTVRLNTTASVANPVNFNGTVTVDLNNLAGNAAFTGVWIGSGTVNFINQDPANRTFTMGGSSANWTAFTGQANIGTNSGGTFRFNDGGGNGNTGNSSATLDMGTGNSSFLTRNRGAAVNLGALFGGPNTRIVQGSSASGISTYSIGGKNTPSQYDGTIQDGNVATAGVALTKVGSSIFTITGTNIYFGLTTISAGTLQVGAGGTSGQVGRGAIVNNATLVYLRSDDIVVSNGISGSGNLVKMGSAVATFYGTNSSSGSLIISNGTAAVGNSGSILCPINVSSGAFFDVSQNPLFTLNQSLSGSGSVTGLLAAVGGSINPGGMGAAGTLSFLNGLNQSNNINNQIELSSVGGTNDLISVTGDLNLSGTNNIILSRFGGGSIPNGTYTLITYSGSLGGSLANLATVAVGVTATLTNPVGAIAVIISPASRGATNLTWVGDGGANNWDIDIASNWVSGVTSFTFKAGDSVRFDATGAANPTVNLASSTLQPANIVVGAATDYTFTGNGSIIGTTGLTKTNTGKLTIATTNLYSGPTIVTGGSLDINNIANGNAPSAIGGSSSSAANLVLSNSTLIYSGGNASTDRGATLNGAGVGLDVTSANVTFTTVAITGPAALNKAGAGTVTFNVQNTYAGGTVISNGVIALGNNNANNDGAGGSGVGATTNLVTLKGGTLQLFGFNGGTGNNYARFLNPLSVPAGQSGTLRMFSRGPINTGANSGLGSSLTGGGTLNLVVNYVRDNLDGDWSAFTGNINVTPKPSGAGDEMRINNAFGYANSAIFLNDGVTMNRVTTANAVVDIGELGGTAAAIIGPGNLSALNPTWVVGWKGTSSTFAGLIANDGTTTVIKVGGGTWTLTGGNSYSGSTTISNGVLALGDGVTDGSIGNTTNINIVAGAALDVSGRSDGTLSLNSGQNLMGSGTVRGTLNVNGGSSVSPGASVGLLTVTNALTLQGGSVTFMELNPAANTNDVIVAQGDSGISYGGTLQLSLAAGSLSGGQTYKLFTASTYNGSSFNDGVKPVTLNGTTWDTSNLNVNGTLSLIAVTNRPVFDTVNYSGSDISFNIINGYPNAEVYVLSTTNLIMPVQWARVATNTFDGSGNLSFTLSGAFDPNQPQVFYSLQLQ